MDSPSINMRESAQIPVNGIKNCRNLKYFKHVHLKYAYLVIIRTWSKLKERE